MFESQSHPYGGHISVFIQFHGIDRHVSQEFSQRVALAPEDVTREMVAEVLPVLELIYLVVS